MTNNYLLSKLLIFTRGHLTMDLNSRRRYERIARVYKKSGKVLYGRNDSSQMKIPLNPSHTL